MMGNGHVKGNFEQSVGECLILDVSCLDGACNSERAPARARCVGRRVGQRDLDFFHAACGGVNSSTLWGGGGVRATVAVLGGGGITGARRRGGVTGR
jgi:hypothetical protein